MKTRMNVAETKRMRREIAIHSVIHHRHILNFYAAFEDSQAFYLVLEHANKGDLLMYLQRQPSGRIPLRKFLQTILLPLLQALSYIHSQGILHRDIKPENLLFDNKGVLRLCDFGMSIQSFNERPQSILGTLEYMAPELIERRPPPYTDRIDVWAIGVLTFECLTGTSPFAGPTDQAIMSKIKAGIIPESPYISEVMRDFVRQCLQLKPSDRPSVRDLLQHNLFHPKVHYDDEEDAKRNIRSSFSFS